MKQPHTMLMHVSTVRGVQGYAECNCTKIMHANYFRVFWVSWIQIGCSMRVVCTECMNSRSNFFLCSHWLQEQRCMGNQQGFPSMVARVRAVWVLYSILDIYIHTLARACFASSMTISFLSRLSFLSVKNIVLVPSWWRGESKAF